MFIFNQSYVFTEADLILVEELLLNLGLAAVGVFVVTLILLVDPRTSLLVVFGIASVDLFLLGELWIGGIRLNTVSVSECRFLVLEDMSFHWMTNWLTGCPTVR